MAENSINFAKEHFKDCDILPRQIPYGEDKLDIVLTLHVKNCRKLKKNIIYYVSAKISEYRWTTKLVIVNGTMFVFMSTNTNMENPKAVIFKVRGDLLRNDIIRQGESFLILEFCHKAIIDSRNGYLHGDRMLIEFRYEMVRSNNELFSTNSSSFQTLKDSSAHSDIIDLYFPHLGANLEIFVRQMLFKCHIAILTERSKFFADFVKKNKLLSNKRTCISINEDPYFFRYVINYIYSGVLDCSDEEGMMEVYRIANKLQIASLEGKCMEYFETNLSSSNQNKFLNFGIAFKLSNLIFTVLRIYEKE